MCFSFRVFDPRVDILTAEWHPFKEVTWVQPLMVDLSDWREKLLQLEKDVYNTTSDTDVVFIADFPGKQPVRYAPASVDSDHLFKRPAHTGCVTRLGNHCCQFWCSHTQCAAAVEAHNGKDSHASRYVLLTRSVWPGALDAHL